MSTPHVGGTFGHRITPEKIARYKELAQSAPEKVRYYMNQLIEMVEVFQKTGKSKLPGVPNPCTANARTIEGKPIPKALITPLEEEEVRRIWDFVPWKEEIELMKGLLNELPSGKRGTGEMEKIPLPPTERKPNNFYLRARTEIADPLAYELKGAFGNLIWHAAQLELDREPLTHQDLWNL